MVNIMSRLVKANSQEQAVNIFKSSNIGAKIISIEKFSNPQGLLHFDIRYVNPSHKTLEKLRPREDMYEFGPYGKRYN